jgi:transposase-like protein
MTKAKRYTPEEREALIAEYNLSGLSINAFCKQEGKPAYQVFKKWIEGTGHSGGAPASSRTGLSLKEEFQARQEDAYKAFLKEKIAELEGQLAAVKGELAKLGNEGPEG